MKELGHAPFVWLISHQPEVLSLRTNQHQPQVKRACCLVMTLRVALAEVLPNSLLNIDFIFEAPEKFEPFYTKNLRVEKWLLRTHSVFRGAGTVPYQKGAPGYHRAVLKI
jgi:hypothetical protein